MQEDLPGKTRKPSASFDGGDLDCGNGLLLLIRKHLDLIEPGQLLEIISTESSVEEDLPAWCRLTGNELLSWTKENRRRTFLVCRGSFAADAAAPHAIPLTAPAQAQLLPSGEAASGTNSAPMNLRPFSVMGVGSWPRPFWLLPYLHKYIEGRISEEEFNAVADDAVRLACQAQIEAQVDLLTDGEQRRDSYASFVGMRLNGCQLIPLTDLLPLVDNPDKFKAELQSLDVPAEKVRHPAVLGKLSRKGSLVLGELKFLSSISPLPAKIALPGPYLLSRIMWMECITDNAYASREELAADLILILREEIRDLLAAGVSLIQLDEPVLTELFFASKKSNSGNQRSFMCGALSEKGNTDEEADFAVSLLNKVLDGFAKERLAMHVCRGNWTPDESAALSGAYEPLLPVFNSLSNLGTLFLEFCTPRAGEIGALKNLRADLNVGLGCVNPKSSAQESVESIVEKAEAAAALLGPERLLLNPDCGFATFAANPVCSSTIAKGKLQALHSASVILQEKYFNVRNSNQ